jgi:hypothetical protein
MKIRPNLGLRRLKKLPLTPELFDGTHPKTGPMHQQKAGCTDARQVIKFVPVAIF